MIEDTTKSEKYLKVKNKMYLFLIDIYGEDGYTLSCKNRERIEDKAVELAKEAVKEQLEVKIEEIEELNNETLARVVVTNNDMDIGEATGIALALKALKHELDITQQ